MIVRHGVAVSIDVYFVVEEEGRCLTPIIRSRRLHLGLLLAGSEGASAAGLVRAIKNLRCRDRYCDGSSSLVRNVSRNAATIQNGKCTSIHSVQYGTKTNSMRRH